MITRKMFKLTEQEIVAAVGLYLHYHKLVDNEDVNELEVRFKIHPDSEQAEVSCTAMLDTYS